MTKRHLMTLRLVLMLADGVAALIVFGAVSTLRFSVGGPDAQWSVGFDVARMLSYEVHGMRELLLGVSTGGWLWLDFLVVAGFLVVTALIAAKTYPRAIL